MNSGEVSRIRRSEVPEYMMKHHGIPVAASTLAKWATIGGGPLITYAGRIPLYDLSNLDIWASKRLSSPVASTSERKSA